jgi:hypothetical protein
MLAAAKSPTTWLIFGSVTVGGLVGSLLGLWAFVSHMTSQYDDPDIVAR